MRWLAPALVVLLLACGRAAWACKQAVPSVDVRVPEEMPTCGEPVEILWVEQIVEVGNTSCRGMQAIVLHLGCADCLVRARVFNEAGWLRDWDAVFQVEDHVLELPRSDDDLARLVVYRIDGVKKCISEPRQLDISSVPIVEIDSSAADFASDAYAEEYARIEEAQEAFEARCRWLVGGVVILLDALAWLARRAR